jgi:hypothetical protein
LLVRAVTAVVLGSYKKPRLDPDLDYKYVWAWARLPGHMGWLLYQNDKTPNIKRFYRAPSLPYHLIYEFYAADADLTLALLLTSSSTTLPAGLQVCAMCARARFSARSQTSRQRLWRHPRRKSHPVQQTSGVRPARSCELQALWHLPKKDALLPWPPFPVHVSGFRPPWQNNDDGLTYLEPVLVSGEL